MPGSGSVRSCAVVSSAQAAVMAGSSGSGVVSWSKPSGTKNGADVHRAPAAIVLGMAGCGKTTLVDAFSAWLDESEEEAQTLPGDGSYVVNLDPAVLEVPYEPNVDIRDTVKYKRVMSEYSLGPNGAIITSLNLFATRFDQVLELVERRSSTVKLTLFDTPGQIETFTWSASGTIITESVAMAIPTVLLFVVDTARSKDAMTFVSNMLYACSIMYKTRLPMVVVFNKVDVAPCAFIEAWMRDFDAFDTALKEDNFAGTLARSMALALEEFYKLIISVGVSATTGAGMKELADAIKKGALEYETSYKPTLEERIRKRKEDDAKRQQTQIDQLKSDLHKDRLSRNAMTAADEIEEELRRETMEKERAMELDNADEADKKDFDELMADLKSGRFGTGNTQR